MELDADMRATTVDIVFIDEDLINSMNPQDNRDNDDDEDD